MRRGVAVLALALAGCGGHRELTAPTLVVPSPTPRPSPSPTATPVATPAPKPAPMPGPPAPKPTPTPLAPPQVLSLKYENWGLYHPRIEASCIVHSAAPAVEVYIEVKSREGCAIATDCEHAGWYRLRTGRDGRAALGLTWYGPKMRDLVMDLKCRVKDLEDQGVTSTLTFCWGEGAWDC